MHTTLQVETQIDLLLRHPVRQVYQLVIIQKIGGCKPEAHQAGSDNGSDLPRGKVQHGVSLLQVAGTGRIDLVVVVDGRFALGANIGQSIGNNVHAHAIGNFDDHFVGAFHLGNSAHQAATGHYLVTTTNGCDHGSVFFGTFL